MQECRVLPYVQWRSVRFGQSSPKYAASSVSDVDREAGLKRPLWYCDKRIPLALQSELEGGLRAQFPSEVRNFAPGALRVREDEIDNSTLSIFLSITGLARSTVSKAEHEEEVWQLELRRR